MKGDGKEFGLVIFDCDGVLIDSEIISCGTIVEVLNAFGVPCDLPRAFERYLGRPASAVTEDYRAATGQAVSSAFMEMWRKRLFESFSATLQPMPGIHDALQRLPVPFCLASSSDADRIAISLGRTGLTEAFDGRAFSTGMVVHGKPAPDLFLFAAGWMRVPPARCLVIEDSPHGIKAAKAAGMTAWGFTGGSHYQAMPEGVGVERLLASGADRVLTGMSALELVS